MLQQTKGGISSFKFARLNLIDLAGSERQEATQTTGMQLKEAGCINKSLTLLGNVIRALVDVANGKVRYVPYRDSRLTFLLKVSVLPLYALSFSYLFLWFQLGLLGRQ